MSRVGAIGRSELGSIGMIAVWSVVTAVVLEKKCLDDRFVIALARRGRFD
jgi:hypothetical protein